MRDDRNRARVPTSNFDAPVAKFFDDLILFLLVSQNEGVSVAIDEWRDRSTGCARGQAKLR
jgi:hypothetical protein